MTAGRQNGFSHSHHWCTPLKYVQAVRDFFDGVVDLDPCSNRFSLVNANVEYSLPGSDGLAEPWNARTVYVNPPYGRDRSRNTGIRDWLRKCSEAPKLFNAEVLALVPVATNTRHWKDYVFGVAEGLAFLYDTRLKFLEDGRESDKGAPMSCAMIYWGRRYSRFEEVFLPFGAVIDLRHLQDITIGEQMFIT